MSRKTDPTKLDHAVELHISGQSLTKSATTAGVDLRTLRRELTSRGIEPRVRIYTHAKLPTDEIIDLYTNQGFSELAIAKKFKISRNPIRTVLKKNGVHIRDGSEAQALRASKMTPEEIAAQTAAAHEATRGRKATWDERAKRAATVEKNPPSMSVHEAAFANSLSNLGIPWRREVAVGIYNLDFALGSVGVEILGGEWHAYKGERHPRRIKYILSEGWSLVYVWATPNYPMTDAAAEYCATFAQEVSRNPSLIGEYRVIRGDAHLISAGRDELDKFSLEESARHSFNLTPSEIGKMGAAARYGRNY